MDGRFSCCTTATAVGVKGRIKDRTWWKACFLQCSSSKQTRESFGKSNACHSKSLTPSAHPPLQAALTRDSKVHDATVMRNSFQLILHMKILHRPKPTGPSTYPFMN